MSMCLMQMQMWQQRQKECFVIACLTFYCECFTLTFVRPDLYLALHTSVHPFLMVVIMTIMPKCESTEMQTVKQMMHCRVIKKKKKMMMKMQQQQQDEEEEGDSQEATVVVVTRTFVMRVWSVNYYISTKLCRLCCCL